MPAEMACPWKIDNRQADNRQSDEADQSDLENPSHIGPLHWSCASSLRRSIQSSRVANPYFFPTLLRVAKNSHPLAPSPRVLNVLIRWSLAQLAACCHPNPRHVECESGSILRVPAGCRQKLSKR